MLIMSLNVGSEFQSTMLLVVNVFAQHQLTRTEGGGRSLRRWKAVEPEDRRGDHFGDQTWWESNKRERVEDATTALSDGADVALDFGHMFVRSTDISSRTSW